MSKSSISIVIATVACVFLSTGPLYAEWPANGAPACEHAYRQQDPKIVSDGAGGMIIAWTDMRSGSADVYAQRLDGSGNPVWNVDGIPIRSGGYEYELVGLVTDGADGAIVLWTEDRQDIFAQHVDGSGVLQWGTSGTTCPASDHSSQHVAVADGAGGVIFAWVESRTNDDVIGQRIDANGLEVWTHGGIYVFSPSLGENESYPCLAADGSGGAVFAAVSGDEVRAQRVYASGTDWLADGVPLTLPMAVNPGPPAIACDGAGGALVAWGQAPATSDRDIYFNAVDGSGTIKHGYGLPICTAADDQQNADIVHVGSGGAVICWEDKRDGGYFRVYAQKIDAFGTDLWTYNGVLVCAENSNQSEPTFLNSGAPELVIAWFDDRHHESCFAQKIDIAGGLVWSSYGVEVLEGELYARGYDFDTDRAGGLIATVGDDRGMTDTDIYAQAINTRGAIYAAEPTIAGIADVPDDQGGWVRITIGPSDRDTVGVSQEPVARYDVWRQVDPASAAAKAAAAERPRGKVRFFESDGARYVTAAPGAVVPSGTWELVGSFAASQDTQYAYLAPTPADSSDSGTVYSTYFVSAHTTNPAVWFASEEDSGYSVDNIPPHVPTGFAVAYNTGSGNQLTWDPCPDDDFKYFRIYRSETPGFVPSEADYVHGTTETDWLDSVVEGWKYHYKISAVDMADNESDPTGGAATGADGAANPARVALYQNVPNPFNPSTTISIALPADAHVRVTVYGIDGRLVRTLVDGSVPAGIKTFTWNGTDNEGNRVSSGVYFCRLETAGETITRKMMLLK